MVRSSGPSSNCILDDFGDVATSGSEASTEEFTSDIEAVFDELERWKDILEHHQDALRGPRP